MLLCRTCGRENPDDAVFCNKWCAAIGGMSQSGRSGSVPAPEKVLVLSGLASTTTFTKSQLNMRIFFEIGTALILIIGGFVLGQPGYGILLGLVALGAGYIIYLLRAEIRSEIR